MRIPFFEFRFSKEHKAELDNAYQRVFESGVFIHGEEVIQVEKEISDYLQSPYTITVGNGYDALFISLKLISEKPLNVLLQANAYPATVNSVINAGHNVIFADIDFRNNGFVEIAEEFFSRNAIDLIIATHLFGSPNRIIGNIPDSVMLMEDFSQAFGTRSAGNFCGTFGKLNAASLYPTKNLGGFGDSGIICTSEKEFYNRAKNYRNYGESDYNFSDFPGVNSRMDELQAAFIRVNLKRIANSLAIKKSIAETYLEELNSIEELTLPKDDSNNTFHQFTIKTSQRDKLKTFLEDHGIGTKIHYPNALFEQKAYSHLDFSQVNKPLLEKWHKSILSLPSFPGLTQDEQEYICQKVKSFFS